MIGIGIDTGGTCTDAVVYDTTNHEVLSYSKTLTTKYDLKIGILKALRKLKPESIQKASYISLSTTLATNACVENKGGRAGLILIGVNPKVIDRMQGIYGLPSSDEIYFLPGNPEEKDPKLSVPPWDKLRADISKFRNFDSVAIVQINPKYNAGIFELETEKILKEYMPNIRCVKGYDLYQEINVQKRAATALLNARLIPVMDDFFDAIEDALKEMNIDLPLVIVKSDGSVMSREYAKERPVETLLCGPAASVIGAMQLVGIHENDNQEQSQIEGIDDAMIVDMGGTTSDIALVKHGKTVSTLSGIRIGEWSTMVKGISIDTFALGGDSGVKYKNGVMYLDNRRMVPICMLASSFPEVTDKLKSLILRRLCYSYPAHEFFILVNKPKDLSPYLTKEKALIEALENGPLSFEEAAEAVDASPFVFKMQRLENEGIIMRSGITPTDVMHIRGDYNEFSMDASSLAIKYMMMATGIEEEEEFCENVYEMVKNKLYGNLARILVKHEVGRELSEDEEIDLKKLTEIIYKKRNIKNEFVNVGFRTGGTLIGVGGPTGIFLDEVANLLGTSALVPRYEKIANAIGAAAGNLRTSYEVRIEPNMNRQLGAEFCLMGSKGFIGFDDYDEALEVAKIQAQEAARERAIAMGARGNIEIKLDVDEDFYQVKKSGAPVFVLTIVRAEATSSII